ncbi:MAG: DNA gyrase inhibitor YacG [Deltaproteobacteria bacterium]|nr:DNA gyrase inhibitor YacG [Myxococcales bacterium]MDP3220614.1 DNA gyrase inhibitor YacG [Deltaproteobacteria bacterium]
MESRCPICKAVVRAGRPENPSAPFCSSRCRDVDLGRWLDGAYSIPVRDELPSEEELALASVRNPDPRRVS